jgi:NADH-quinone oxidoreductase subunit K
VHGIGLTHFLVVSAILFALGSGLIIVRRNAVLVLMGLELVLNAAALNFVAFSRFVPVRDYGGSRVAGDSITAFVIVLAAAEAAVALAIVLNIYNNFSTIDVDEVDQLRD